MADRLYFNLTRYGVDEFYVSWGYPIRPVKSLIASKQSATAALDTRTGTRTVAAKESIAYDAAWGEATSGTLTVNGTAVSGLSSKGNYSWTPNTSQTNYWKLAYTAGTANYSATFKHLANYAITYADTKGAANSNPAQYNYDSSITFAALPNVTGYVFNGWNPAKIAAGGFGAKTVTAKWTPISYTVKFNANGGSGTGLGPSLPCDIISGRSAAMAHGKSASICVSPVVRRHWGCRGPTRDFTSERSDMKSHRCPPLLSSRIRTLLDHSALHSSRMMKDFRTRRLDCAIIRNCHRGEIRLTDRL